MTPAGDRPWKLWQVETALACNLDCVMCPWKAVRRRARSAGLMADDVWEALKPRLREVESIDFSGGGEPLLQPRLAGWIRRAAEAGCTTGFLTNGTLLDEATCAELLAAGVDWIAVSVDGAEAETYESIRRGASFEAVRSNLRRLVRARAGRRPWVMINFVMMPSNVGQLRAMVRMASELGADQVNFKHCDVIRGNEGRELGLFASKADKKIRRMQRELARACRLARRLDVVTTAFSFTPDELPVCAQDPRRSLFVRYDGRVSPCIGQAYGGPSSFLGRDVVMPEVAYGRLPRDDLRVLWDTEDCRFYRERFDQRIEAHDAALHRLDPGSSPLSLREYFARAREAMPAAPEGCRSCHYLYDV